MSADEWAGLRVYMKDRLKFLRDAASVAAATDAMGKAAQRSGDSADYARGRSWAWSQALFTMRRMVYGATLAISGAVVGVAALGVRFDIMRQNANFAFTTLLGSSKAASAEVEYLFNLAAKTPFEFGNVQQFSRQFLGWGFSLKQTNRYLTDFADVISAMGGDVSIMDRVSLAFGQIRSSGVLLGQDLRQLQQAIPGVSSMLQKQLGLSTAQMQKGIGALRIPSNVAIEAIMRGIESDPRFKGAAAKMQKSAQGQLSTLHDYASRLFGDLVAAPFGALVSALPNINKDIYALALTLENRGFSAFLDQLDGMVGAGGMLSRTVKNLAGTLKSLWGALKPVWYSFKDLATIVLPLVFLALWGLAGVLDFVGSHTTTFRILLDLLIARFLFLTSLRVSLWFLAVAASIGRLYTVVRAMTALEILFSLTGVKGLVSLIAKWRAWAFAMRYAGRAGRVFANVGIWAKFSRFLFTAVVPALSAAAAAAWEFALALLANPITWIVAAIIVLVGVLVLLYLKWQWFHNAVDATYHFIINNWPYVSLALAGLLGPLTILAAAVLALIANFKTLVGWAKTAWSWTKTLGGWISAPGDWVDQSVFGNDPNAWAKVVNKAKSGAAHQATGGMVTSPGWSWVGEQGRELHYMGRGATTVPLDRVGALGLDHVELEAVAPVILKVDSETLATAVARIRLKKRARS